MRYRRWSDWRFPQRESIWPFGNSTSKIHVNAVKRYKLQTCRHLFSPADGGREEGNDSVLWPRYPAGHSVTGLRSVATHVSWLVPHQHDQSGRRGWQRLAHLGHNSLQVTEGSWVLIFDAAWWFVRMVHQIWWIGPKSCFYSLQLPSRKKTSPLR